MNKVKAIHRVDWLLREAKLPTYSHLVDVIVEVSSIFDNYPVLELVGTKELVDDAMERALVAVIKANIKAKIKARGISSLPMIGNTVGDLVRIDKELYVWSGTEWISAGKAKNI
jgi:hypothetical protein